MPLKSGGSMTFEHDKLLIVGAGHAGAELAVTARQLGWAGSIDLLGDEPVLPYQRPPLSKGYLHGAATPDTLALRPAEVYERANIGLLPEVRLVSIDRAARQVRVADGRLLSYTKLALCLGGRPRPLLV